MNIGSFLCIYYLESMTFQAENTFMWKQWCRKWGFPVTIIVTQEMLEKVIDFFLLSMKISATAGRKVKFTILILSSACIYSIEKMSKT